MTIETRFVPSALEIRSGGDGRTVIGLAAPYHQPAVIAGRYTETLVPGSFDTSFGVPLHAGHDAELPVSPPGKMTEASDGLYGEWRVSRTSAGDDLLTLIHDQAVRGLSVGFSPNEERDLWDGPSSVTRYAARLFHVAATTAPAYKGASVLSVRAGRPGAEIAAAATVAPRVAQQFLERRAQLYGREEIAPDTPWQAQLHLRRR